MQAWNVLHAARWKYRTQKWRKKSPSAHHRTTLSGHIFVTEAHIDNWKKFVKQHCSIVPKCLYNMVNFGPLAAEIVSLVWGTPANFNRFRAYSKPSRIRRIPYFHTWCGLSANLGCWSETCCTRLAENTGRQKFTNCAPSHKVVGLYLRDWGMHQPNFAGWTEGATYIWQGGHHVGYWPTF